MQRELLLTKPICSPCVMASVPGASPLVLSPAAPEHRCETAALQDCPSAASLSVSRAVAPGLVSSVGTTQLEFHRVGNVS